MAIRNKTTQNNPRDYDDEGSKSEVSAFKKGLLDISLETIRERLAGKTITRQWKRDLVEAELARREEDELDAGAAQGPAKKKGGRTGQWAAAAIIGVCSLIILYTMFEIWQK
jgi:hypothetical protein